MKQLALLLAVLVCWSSLHKRAPGAEPASAANQFFEAKIRPVLIEHCYQCHGPDEAAGKLRLDTRQGWQRGGERGPAIVPHDPAASLLFTAISNRDAKLRMPPPDAGQPLSAEVIDDLRPGFDRERSILAMVKR